MSAISAITAVAIENARHFEWLVSENQRLIADFNIEHNHAWARVRPFVKCCNSFPGSAHRFPPFCSPVEWHRQGARRRCARFISTANGRTKLSWRLTARRWLSRCWRANCLVTRGILHRCADAKKGRLEIADGGTVFLDEIGELSPALQVKLLRVLQEREFERVGGTRAIKVDIRLITATNENLEESIANGSFRQDLYYRLNVVNLEMPALRERPEDIPLLANYFAAKYAERVQPADNRNRGRGAGASGWLRLARQCARTGERDRAGGGVRSVPIESCWKTCRNLFWNQSRRLRRRERSIMKQWLRQRGRLFSVRCSRRREVTLKLQNFWACIQTICTAWCAT